MNKNEKANKQLWFTYFGSDSAPKVLFLCISLFYIYYLLKLSFTVYAITYYNCPNFFSFAPPPNLPTPSGNPHTIVHVHGSCIYILWLLYSLCCTLHPHDYSVTTNVYFLINSPIPKIPLLSGNHQNIL